MAPDRDRPTKLSPLTIPNLTERTATFRAISLSLAAIAILIFCVAMDIEDQHREALCGGRRTARIAVPNGASPYVELAADGKTGPFLLDYGATRSSLSADAFPGPEGAVRRATISLPGIEEALFHLARYDLLLQPEQGTARRHWRRSPVQAYRRAHSERVGFGRRALPAAGADRARPHAG
jgi:hypothetical protein